MVAAVQAGPDDQAPHLHVERHGGLEDKIPAGPVGFPTIRVMRSGLPQGLLVVRDRLDPIHDPVAEPWTPIGIF